MALTRIKKESIISDVDAKLASASSAVFVHVKGVPVSALETLRATLRSSGAGFKVVKKTLLKRSLNTFGATGDMPELTGEVAVAWGTTDALAPSREIFAFKKGREAGVMLLGGIFEGAYQDAAAVTALATIPSQQVLRGMFVNVINSPIQRVVIALGQIAETKTSA
jgi:large subunit ribosomal protein L10